MMFSKTECMSTLMERPESIFNNGNLDILLWTLWDIFNGIAQFKGLVMFTSA